MVAMFGQGFDSPRLHLSSSRWISAAFVF